MIDYMNGTMGSVKTEQATAPLRRLVFAGLLLFVSLSSQHADAFDHEYVGYQSLLEAYVQDGLVNYAALAGDTAVLHGAVTCFLELSAEERAAFSPSQKLAFWINAYNLFTIVAIVDHYPVSSIKKIKGVWNKLKWKVAGKELTLDNIEHDILRKEFKEPRIHVTIVCASISCPELYDQPYRAAVIEEQLQARSEAFARDPMRNELDLTEQRMRLSKILDWYGGDFIGRYGAGADFDRLSGKQSAVAKFIYDHLPASQRERVDKTKLHVSNLDYDWSLNEVKSAQKSTIPR